MALPSYCLGYGMLIKSGTVHTLSGVVIFEIQENSDVTFRLFDWKRIDVKTGKPGDLQVDEALACIDFNETDIGTVSVILKSEGKLSKELHLIAAI